MRTMQDLSKSLAGLPSVVEHLSEAWANRSVHSILLDIKCIQHLMEDLCVKIAEQLVMEAEQLVMEAECAARDSTEKRGAK